MNNEDFKVRIVDLYKDIGEPIINNLYKDKNTQEIMVLSVQNDLSLFKKNKKKCVVKDKRRLLKEIDVMKNKKVKELTSSISKLGKDSPDIKLIRDTNNKMISQLESMDNLKKSLKNEEIYLKLKDLAKIQKGGSKGCSKNLSDISRLSESEDYLEIFSN